MAKCKRGKGLSIFFSVFASICIFTFATASRTVRAEKDCDSDVIEIYVSYDVSADAFRIQDERDGMTVAHAVFQDCINSTGWSYLTVTTVAANTRGLNSSVQAYAAGLVEGHVTRELISLHYLNTVGHFCQNKTERCKGLEWFLRANLDWVYHNVETNPDDNYWYQVRLFYEQLRGLEDGYAGKPGHISMEVDNVFGLYLLQIWDDIPDIEKALFGASSTGPAFGHCSALIKVLLGNGKVKDVLTSHDTWSSYNTMLRVLKYYYMYLFQRPSATTPALGSSWAFSSYPGTLVSTDDFYVLSSAMVTLETTNPLYNDALFKAITPQSVLEPVRVTVANRLGDHGDSWCETFARYNSGTYNNQWMVVDYKQYDQYWQNILPGFLTVLEQIPGKVHYEDMTEVLLTNSYWASYNLPYYSDIFEVSGLPAMVTKYGDFFSHDESPRARMFRRDQHTVVDFDTMTRLMRYNDFQHDPLSRCNCTPSQNADNAISARSDLNPPDGTYPFPDLDFGLRGGIDMKLTSMSMTDAGDKLAFWAISGPTFDPLPPFQWSTAFNPDDLSHWGQPDLWNFGPVWFNWTF